MIERLKVLDDLGAELDRAARNRFSGRGVRRLAPRRLSVLAVVIAVLVLAAAAAAAVLLTQQGAPLPPPHAQDLQSGGVPQPGSARLAGLDAPDPDGGALPWDIRLSRTRTDETCSAVGQVLRGQFGIVGLDHVFRAVPLGGVDACGVDSTHGPVLAGARVFVGSTPQEARTVVNGVAGDGARSVTAYGPEGARTLKLGPHGSFITVYRGRVEEVRPRIVIVTGDGRSHAVAFAQSLAFEASDPVGGAPWQVSAGADLDPGAYPDESCAQATRELGPEQPSRFESPLTPEVCGRLASQPLFAVIRRFVPGSGEHTGWPWGNNPARTLVYGAAAPRVRSLTLRGDGAPRALPVDPRSGAFLAVLDGHVDPRSLVLTARLGNGQTVTYTRAANLLEYERNHPLVEAPVPPYSEPRPVSATRPAPFELPQPSSVREMLRAVDPAGAGTWVLRSWQGRANPRANFAGGLNGERFTCIEVGLANGSTLLEPRAGAAAVPLSINDEMGRCNQPRDLTRIRYMLQMESYLADPYAYQPRPARTVLSGELPPAATDPVLLGAGPPRRLTLDANHAFLVVLPGGYWTASPHITYRRGGRTVGAGSAARFPLGPTLAWAQARTPDPDGGAPWGFAATSTCSRAIGRVVDGHLASIDELTGVLKTGPMEWGSGGGCPTHPQPHSTLQERQQPVTFDVQPISTYDARRGHGSEPLTPPQVQRRTLPGRTVITGIARADVTSVTLSTPRDVRTLRPTGRLHVIIAVYDGQFFRGVLTATVTLRNGRTETEPLLGAPDTAAPPLPVQSLTAMLHTGERQLAELRAGPAPRRGTQGPPGSRSREALVRLAERLRTIRARIAYERSHPGELPQS
jgi:hypothetical protein